MFVHGGFPATRWPRMAGIEHLGTSGPSWDNVVREVHLREGYRASRSHLGQVFGFMQFFLSFPKDFACFRS